MSREPPLLSKDLEKSLPQGPCDSPPRPSASPLPSFTPGRLLLLWRKSGRSPVGRGGSSDRQRRPRCLCGGLPETWEVAGRGNPARACYLPAKKPLRATSLGLRPAFRPMSARELHDVHLQTPPPAADIRLPRRPPNIWISVLTGLPSGSRPGLHRPERLFLLRRRPQRGLCRAPQAASLFNCS